MKIAGKGAHSAAAKVSKFDQVRELVKQLSWQAWRVGKDWPNAGLIQWISSLIHALLRHKQLETR